MVALTVGRVLLRPRTWSGAVKAGKQLPGAQISRIICTSTAVQKKNVAASGPEKYTEAFIKKQIEEFQLGKRHLANMMGEDPETFTQEDIDKAIAYLFPSGLFEKKARPIMKHPVELFPKQRAIQWDEDGRPIHFLFYTGRQSYYCMMHELYGRLLHVQKHQDEMRAQGLAPENTAQLNLIGSRWLIKEELEEMLAEKLSDQDHLRCIHLLERLVALPCCGIEKDYILKFRKQLLVQSRQQVIEPLKYDEQGVAFSTAEARRNTATAKVTVYGNGSGKITVNGDDYILYFPVLQDREQLMFPFQFLDRLEKHDTICSVSGSGRAGQAGAIRLAIAKALCSFITKNEVEFMRQAGLLTSDPRRRERKKPGQEGARRKYTWKKR
uniref:Small ribosomal subunit protein uS9m n=1 Tax=Salvator merianae TaxID=96440 RepID=A0A8D0DHL3_SALMN